MIAPAMARNPELETAILADPDNVDGYLVYADWLTQAGDARGELINVHHRLLRTPHSKKLKKRSDEILASEIDSLLGRLSESGAAEVEWYLGFARRVRIHFGWDVGHAAPSFDQMMAELKTHASYCFLQELAVGFPGPVQYELDAHIPVIAAGEYPSLRMLHLGDFQFPDEALISDTSLGDLGALWPKCPRLEEIVLQGGHMTLGSVDLPRARSFTMRTSCNTHANIASIVDADWPELRWLELWFGSHTMGASGGVEELSPLLRSDRLPKLENLSIRNAEFTDDLCRVLGGQPVFLSQLERIDLSLGTMSDHGANAIASARAHFAHLDEIDVSGNFLTADGLATLRTVCHVISSNQRTEWNESLRTARVTT